MNSKSPVTQQTHTHTCLHTHHKHMESCAYYAAGIELALSLYSVKSDHIVLADWRSVRVRRDITLCFLSATSLLEIHSSQVSLLGKNNTCHFFLSVSHYCCALSMNFFFSPKLFTFLLQWKQPLIGFGEWPLHTHHSHPFEPVHWAARGEGSLCCWTTPTFPVMCVNA